MVTYGVRRSIESAAPLSLERLNVKSPSVQVFRMSRPAALRSDRSRSGVNLAEISVRMWSPGSRRRETPGSENLFAVPDGSVVEVSRLNVDVQERGDHRDHVAVELGRHPRGIVVGRDETTGILHPVGSKKKKIVGSQHRGDGPKELGSRNRLVVADGSPEKGDEPTAGGRDRAEIVVDVAKTCDWVATRAVAPPGTACRSGDGSARAAVRYTGVTRNGR